MNMFYNDEEIERIEKEIEENRLRIIRMGKNSPTKINDFNKSNQKERKSSIRKSSIRKSIDEIINEVEL